MTLPYTWTDRDGIEWEVTVSGIRRSIQGSDGPLLTTVVLAARGLCYAGMTTKPVDTLTKIVPGPELQRILDEARRGRSQ